jgi:hypothetical protein
VKNELYKIERSHKEPTKDAINWLHRSFTYAMTRTMVIVKLWQMRFHVSYITYATTTVNVVPGVRILGTRKPTNIDRFQVVSQILSYLQH